MNHLFASPALGHQKDDHQEEKIYKKKRNRSGITCPPMDISKKTTGFEGFEAPVEDDAAAIVEMNCEEWGRITASLDSSLLQG